MGTVMADMTMSVDGFIADPDDDVGPLFDWYSEGPVEFTFPGDGMQTHVSAASAGHLDRVVSELGRGQRDRPGAGGGGRACGRDRQREHRRAVPR